MTIRRHPQHGLDAAAFVAAFDEHSRAFLRYFARRTLDAEVAADLTAETFAQAYESRREFDPERGDIGAWLYGIARHQLGSYLRRLRVDRGARQRLGLPDRSPTADDCERIEALIDFAEVGRLVRSALAELPADQRQAVVCRVTNQMSYAEIAEHFGCSQDVARARVSRGLRQLARMLPQLSLDDTTPGART